MSRRLLVAALAALVTAWVPLRAADDLGLALFEQYLDSLRRQAGIPGLAVALVGDEGIVWDRGMGRQDVERSLPMRIDTPIQIDGLTEAFTAVLTLRCVEQGRLALGDRMEQFDQTSSEPAATLFELLTHTSGSPDGLEYAYRPERLKPFTRPIRACEDSSYRETLANTFERLAMFDSVPGPDAPGLVPPAEGIPTEQQVSRYRAVLERLATPYAVVDQGRRPVRSQYTVTELSPYNGVISSVRDLAQFDLALRKGVLVRPETLAAVWQNPAGAGGQPLPHAPGWFVQSYRDELVVWQFGMSENASSSLMVHVPSRHITLIMLANSDDLVRPFPLQQGDLGVSPIGRLFLRLFIG